jgi:hypothetical protein
MAVKCRSCKGSPKLSTCVHQFFSNETTNNASDILKLLEDSYILAWYACMHDVLPVLTRMNIRFQSTLPLPHLLFPKLIFRASEFCADLWNEMTKHNAGAHNREEQIDYTVVYPYYRQLLQMPDLKAFTLLAFALFVLVFQTGTGNAISVRDFSAMGATHSKQRSELSSDQVFAHLVIALMDLK